MRCLCSLYRLDLHHHHHHHHHHHWGIIYVTRTQASRLTVKRVNGLIVIKWRKRWDLSSLFDVETDRQTDSETDWDASERYLSWRKWSTIRLSRFCASCTHLLSCLDDSSTTQPQRRLMLWQLHAAVLSLTYLLTASDVSPARQLFVITQALLGLIELARRDSISDRADVTRCWYRQLGYMKS